MNAAKLASSIIFVITSLSSTMSYAQDPNNRKDNELLNNPNTSVNEIIRGSNEPYLIPNHTITKLFLAYIESLRNTDEQPSPESYGRATDQQLAGLKYDLGLNDRDANTLVSIALDTTLFLSKQRESAINEICSENFLAANKATNISGMISHTKVMQSEIDTDFERYFNAEIKNEFGTDGLKTIRDWLSATFVPGVVQAD